MLHVRLTIYLPLYEGDHTKVFQSFSNFLAQCKDLQSFAIELHSDFDHSEVWQDELTRLAWDRKLDAATPVDVIRMVNYPGECVLAMQDLWPGIQWVETGSTFALSFFCLLLTELNRLQSVQGPASPDYHAKKLSWILAKQT